jgi:hypothetical protein
LVLRDAQSHAGTALTMMMAQASTLSSMVGSAGAHKFKKTKPKQIAMTRKRLLLILARSVCPPETAPDPNQLISVWYEPLNAVLDAFGEFMSRKFYRVQLLTCVPDV